VPQHDVLRDGEVGGEVDLLVDRADAGLLGVGGPVEAPGRAGHGDGAGVAVFRYGSFITAVINFLIIAWVVFLLVKGVNKARALVDTSEKSADAPAGPTQEEGLIEIRDHLRDRPTPRPPA
jgi:large-conductance mechanosensitive channel